jgi:benzoyl-CoA reductase/2-hydroxyglutaryl-CoA dehydratase subunit BcrC/BadD/HgdB
LPESVISKVELSIEEIPFMAIGTLKMIEELANVARTRPEQLKEKRKRGAKLIGCMGSFVPEELIHASEAVPYMMCRGGEPEPPDAAIPYLLKFMSPYGRAQIGYHILGVDPVMPMLDLIVMQSTDCMESRLADVFEYLNLPTARLGVPPDWEKAISLEYFQKQVAHLKERLEALTGNHITDDKLKGSIESMNQIRELLKKISLLRKEPLPPLGGYDFMRLNHYSFYCEPDILLRKLKELYEGLQKGMSPFKRDAPRIMLAGHVVGVGDYVAPKLIEDCGAVIATEFLDEGIRRHEYRVKTDGDLMKNLAEAYYFERIPPSIFQPAWEERIEIIKEVLREFNIDGVIWYQLSFEEIYDMESSIVRKSMDEMNMPFLKLESSYEYSREAMGPLTTRIESFIELVKQAKVSG